MLHLSYNATKPTLPVDVPGSKSIANRLLVLQYLYFPNLDIQNLPESSDTKILRTCLTELQTVNPTTPIYVGEGGTTLRFLLAVMSVTNAAGTLTGAKQLLERPHDALINALNAIGFNTVFTDLGIQVSPANLSMLKTEWKADISKSSQFASALCMIAPYTNNPVRIELIGQPVSMGYLDMTIQLMQELGIAISRHGNIITSKPFELNTEAKTFYVESDWSGISYMISIAAIARKTITINNVTARSVQPDIEVLEYAKLVGLIPNFTENQLVLTPEEDFSAPDVIHRDYTTCPDLLPAEIVCSYALGIDLHASGTQHLVYKESDRTQSLKTELNRFTQSKEPVFQSHHDHRVAMALAPLAILKPIKFAEPEVVSKSFPDFWKQLDRLGFSYENV